MLCSTEIVFKGQLEQLSILKEQLEEAMLLEAGTPLSSLLSHVGYTEKEILAYGRDKICGVVVRWFFRDYIGVGNKEKEFVVITETMGHPCLQVFVEFLRKLDLDLKIVFFSATDGESRVSTNSDLYEGCWWLVQDYDGLLSDGDYEEEELAKRLAQVLWKEEGMDVHHLIELYQDQYPDTTFSFYDYVQIEEMF